MENFQFSEKFASENIISIPNSNLFHDESKMEVVKAFNNELVSLYDIKPPISKAKMTAITKAAMKSVKFYKHVVHGVEKFILKCRPDYKIPGLYVIDSIVRQSRHQFGIEKDVFAPRFSKNLLQTFKNICTCPEDDKQKLVRVINLWQKHKVFPDDLLKKFLVMAEASEEELPELYKDEIEAIQKSSKKSPTSGKKKKKSPAKTGLDTTPLQNSFYSSSTPNALNSTPRLDGGNKNSVDPSLLQQLQTLTSLLQQSTTVPTVNASPAASNVTPGNDQVKFDRKLLEYDYGEEEEEGSTQSFNTQQPVQATDPITSILTNPDIMLQLHNLQVQLSKAQAQAKPQDAQLPSIMEQHRMFQSQQMQAFNQAMMQQQQQYAAELYAGMQNAAVDGSNAAAVDDDLDDKPEIVMEKTATEPLEVIDLDHIATPPSDKSHRRSYSRSRSRSRSRTPSRSRRSRRRSRSRSWNRERSRDRERNEDRHRRALPPIKRKHLAVCSTTLWVGHLSKLVQEQDLSDTFGEYGDIVSIDLIPPRGCAFLCMNRRQDAYRALHKLKNTKLHGKAITIAWAPGKGMKGREWKDYWEVDYGVSYIPWNKLTPDTDYDLLEEGGMLDQETMPEWLKTLLEEKRKIPYSKSSNKALYTPSGTDMDESSNDGDDMQRSHSRASNDMIIESTTNGVPEQMIPLPEGPQPMIPSNTEMPPLGIPLPPQNPAGSLPPPPNLINPFGIPPRLLGPMGVLGGNFMPPLGVPPPGPGLLMSPQQMLNRLPPPFNAGPAGLSMLNAGPNVNTSLSQIPLPDGSSNLATVTSGMSLNNDFKPPPFGLTPPMLFPGNPNIKIDLPGNPNLSMPLPPNPNDMNNDVSNPDNSNPFMNTFPNLMPFNKIPNVSDQDERSGGETDTDYRILGDISNASVLNNSASDDNANNQTNKNDNRGGYKDDETNRHRDRNDFGRDREHRYYDRNQRIYDKERDNKYHRDHRLDGRSPYRESSYDNDRYKHERGGDFRRNTRFDNSREFKRGRDFRGGRSRDQGPIRPRGRSRETDRYRDIRRDYGAPESENKSRRFDKRGRSRERSSDNTHNGKRSRWGDKVTEQSWNKPDDEWNKSKDTWDKQEEENWDKEVENWDKCIDENQDSKTETETQNQTEPKWDAEEESAPVTSENTQNLDQNEVVETNDNDTSIENVENSTECRRESNDDSKEAEFESQNLETQSSCNNDDNPVEDGSSAKNNDHEGTWHVTASEQDIPLPDPSVAAHNEYDESRNTNDSKADESQEYENDESFPSDNCPPAPTFHNPVQFRFREPRMMFQNRMLMRGSPIIGHFGAPGASSGPFSPLPNFQRARFQGHRPHPSFFQGPPRHFAPRQFMPSRSNNF